MAQTRLDKYLADAGLGTRSQVKDMIKKGKVTVDGNVAKDPGIKVNETSNVCVAGASVSATGFKYYMFHKPAGCVTATKDNLSTTVLDYLKGVNTKDLFPVGRLDKDTEGLLLITNDGQLSHDLLSPWKHVEKRYEVRLDKELLEEDKLAIEDCIDIGDDKPCLPAKIEYCHDDSNVVDIIIKEGRFHQVKRMFAARGYKVEYLKRIAMGKLILDDKLAPGDYKEINISDII